MPDSFELSNLDPNSFEHLVNQLALRVLGSGHTGFGPGADAGRDGYFDGEAPYPSAIDHWSGVWYIQSKFHKPNLSSDPQKWLLEQVNKEIKAFKDPEKERVVPDNWILATNVEPSGGASKGSFDKAKAAASKAFPKMKNRFHIWGGRKILDFLNLYPEVTEYYRHFLTPGHILSALYDHFEDVKVELDAILNFLIRRQFVDQQYTKLEQAGSDADSRPGIHKLFIDIPFETPSHYLNDMVLRSLVKTASKCHLIDTEQPDTKRWKKWNRHPHRARVWFVKGGPGQGKSTIGQYFSQIQRASHILNDEEFPVLPAQRTTALEIREIAESHDLWSDSPRIPVAVELKEFAQWFSERKGSEAKGVLTYLAEHVGAGIEQQVQVSTLKRLMGQRSWFFAFDGLDEVPHDVKDKVADEIKHFVDNVVLENKIDAVSLCTSRPQGYSGQFDDLDGPILQLNQLSPQQALRCAMPVLRLGRSEEEAQKSHEVLKSAIASSSVRELMTTPLQSHIMAVVVRDGGRPPERRWQLFSTFYDVIKRREANRNLPDARLAKLLREDEQLLKTVHNRLGFVLHARAETSKGAVTNLSRMEFQSLVTQAVNQMIDQNINETVATVMEATAERLVLVNTPDDGNHVRFDVRQFQEFFAAEFLYEATDIEALRERMEVILGDSHWAEVSHFLLSALIENDRRSELAVAVEILDKLNNEDQGEADCFLSRRLARGAFLSARLLQEGVLEQDKRLRNRFRRCLDPLIGLIEMGPLQPLILTNQLNSVSWLIDILIDSLHSVSRSENAGACAVLSFILEDDHPRVIEVKELLMDAPMEYISAVLSLRTNASRRRGGKLSTRSSQWLMEVILSVLLSSREQEIEHPLLIDDIKDFLNENINLMKSVATRLGIPKIDIAQLVLLVRRGNELARKKGDEFDFGLVRGYFVANNWRNRQGTEKFKHLEDANREPQGILRPVQYAIRFISTPSTGNLNCLLDEIGKSNTWFDVLPRSLMPYIPLVWHTPLQPQIAFLRTLNDSELENLPNGLDRCPYQIQLPLFDISSGEECTSDQWNSLVNFSPSWALDIWDKTGWGWRYDDTYGRPKCIDNVQAATVLISALTKNPTVLWNQPGTWGQIFDSGLPGSTELRNVISSIDEAVVYQRPFRRSKVIPFRLNLPKETSLLVQLIRFLGLDIVSFSETLENSWDFNTEDFASRDELEAIIDDLQIACDVRAAALILLLVTPMTRFALILNFRALLVEFSTKVEDHWYLMALARLFADPNVANNSVSKTVLNDILKETRLHYASRSRLSPILTILRESSVAPVTRSGLQEKWLAAGNA